MTSDRLVVDVRDPSRGGVVTRSRRDTAAAVIGAGGMLVFFLYANWLERDTWFWVDDFNWLITFHDGSVLEASNGHLMLLPGALVYASLRLVGFDDAYVVLRLVALVALVGFAVAVWRYVRQRTDAAVATVAALAVLWFASNGIDAIYPSFVNHSLPMLITVVVADRLDRTRPSLRDDVITTLLVVVAVSCSSTGLIVLVVVGTHVALPRTRPARWWLLGSPAVAWVAWYAAIGRDATSSGSDRAVVPSVREFLAHTDTLIRTTFVDLGAGNPAIGYLLGVGFLVLMGWSVTRWRTWGLGSVRWLVAAAAFIALTSTVLTGTRMYFGEPPRYRLILATFLILAVAESLRGVAIDHRVVAALGLVVGASALVLIDGLQRQHLLLTAERERIAPLLLGAEAAGAGADRDRILPDLSFDHVHVGQYLDLVDGFGSPRDDLAAVRFRPESADAADRVLRTEALITVAPGTCDSGASIPASSLFVEPGTTVVVRSLGRTSRVLAARFGRVSPAVQPIAVVEDGESVVIELPEDPVPIPWQLVGTTGAVLAVC